MKKIDKQKLLDFVDKYNLVQDYEIKDERIINFIDKHSSIKIRGASLNDHITCYNLAATNNGLFDGLKMFLSLADKDAIKKIDEIVEKPMSDNALFEVLLFKRNVISPKFSIVQAIKISQVFPDFVHEIAAAILAITGDKK